MYTFTFNSKTSPYATKDVKYNQMFILQQERFINDMLKVRGYVYLNTIYEMFGVKWDIEWENIYLDYVPGAYIQFAIRGANEDGFDIDII